MRALSPLGLAALTYASELAWRVGPLHEATATGCTCRVPKCDNPASTNRGKHPRIGGGFHAFSTHPEALAAWWDRWPTANVGLWPAPSGLLVIDLDGPTGHASAARIGLLDVPTLACISGRANGGRHLYFRHPGIVVTNARGKDLPGIDVRGDNGFVVVAPSLHYTGTVYRFEGSPDDVAELPAEILKALLPEEKGSGGGAAAPRPYVLARPSSSSERRAFDAWLAKVDTGFGVGEGRADTAYRIAARGLEVLPPSDVLEVLRHWNQFNRVPLDDDKLASTVLNAGKYRKGAA